MVKYYILNILVAIDQFFNTIIGGDPDETISSRMGKLLKKNSCKLCKLICKILNKLDINHCEKNIEYDEGSDASIKDE